MGLVSTPGRTSWITEIESVLTTVLAYLAQRNGCCTGLGAVGKMSGLVYDFGERPMSPSIGKPLPPEMGQSSWPGRATQRPLSRYGEAASGDVMPARNSTGSTPFRPCP